MIPLEDAIKQLNHDIRAIIPRAGSRTTVTLGEIVIYLGALKNEREENEAMQLFIKEKCGCIACLHYKATYCVDVCKEKDKWELCNVTKV